MMEDVARVLDRLSENEDRPFAEWLARQPDVSEEAGDRVCRFIEGFHAADPERAGTAWLARSSGGSGGGGNARFRVLEGFGRVPDAILAATGPRCELLLDTIVTDITWRRGSVEVRCRSPEGEPLPPVRAPRAVVTLPHTILACDADTPGAVRFDPPVPSKLEAARALGAGPVIKLVLRFREAFWNDALHLHDGKLELFLSDGPFPTWWTTAPVLAPVLVAWAGGPAAARVRERGDPTDLALDSLAAMLRMPAAEVHDQLVAIHFHNWTADPFARAAYSWVPAGALEAQQLLARPIEDTLFFAGEATATDGGNGTVDGAIASGWRAGGEAAG